MEHVHRVHRPSRPRLRPGPVADSPEPRWADLQHSAGNAAVASLLQRQGAATATTTTTTTTTTTGGAGGTGSPAAAPDVWSADSPVVWQVGVPVDAQIGVLQQRLNVVGAAVPPLPITAEYDLRTALAVTAYQAANGLPANGVADGATRARLAAATPQVTRYGRRTLETPGQGNPMATPEGSTHPTVRFGSRGPAVEELQQRLNNAAEVPEALVVDGIFGPLTRRAVVQFQRAHGLGPDGIVGPLTWGQLDQVPGPVTVGRVEFESREELEGTEYGGPSRYTWRLLPDRLQVRVNIRFADHPSHPRVNDWLTDITAVWNNFKLVNESDPNDQLLLDFVPGRSSPFDATVHVVVDPPGNPGRSDTENWHTGDPDRGLAPHEFGHLIGLDDEYNRPEEAYVETTGEQPFVGLVEAPDGAAAADVATELRTAVTGSPANQRGAAARSVMQGHSLLGKQGAYFRRVAAAYESAYAGQLRREDLARQIHNDGTRIDQDLAARIPSSTGDEASAETAVTSCFLYSNASLMGTMGTVSGTSGSTAPVVQPGHDHPVAPRHVRQFVEIVARNRGGRWRSEPR